jgi:PilZ domain-containing protein
MRQERRRVPRTKVLRPARIIAGAGNFTRSIDCLVLDLTSLGACVQAVNSPLSLPDESALTFDGAHTLRPFRVAWQSDESFGVEFLGAAAKPTVAG